MSKKTRRNPRTGNQEFWCPIDKKWLPLKESKMPTFKQFFIENFDFDDPNVWIIDLRITLRKNLDLPSAKQLTAGEFDHEEFDEMKNILIGLGLKPREYSNDYLGDSHAMLFAVKGEDNAWKAVEIFENNAELMGRKEMETEYGDNDYLNTDYGYAVAVSAYQLNDDENI